MIFNSFIMAAAAFLLLPASSASVNSVQRQDQDFSWDITALEGYPTINFDADSVGSEIVFMYNFTGTLDNDKYLEPKLFLGDCETQGTLGALTILNSTDGNELTLDVDVVQALIDPSDYYVKAPDELSANITFCVRVDYMYTPFGSNISESVNFHETRVTISVDLTAGFQLTSIDAERTDPDEKAADAELDYPVIAYYCNEGNEELATDPVYNQGDVMQVCVRIGDEVADEDIFVKDIVSFILSQGGDPALAALPTTAIQNRQTDPLTFKVCGTDGRCNVQHQLTSKFFDDPSPGDLEINGIALIGFGTPIGSGRKLLRVPVRGLLRSTPQEEEKSARRLQTSSGTESEFGLSAQLNSGILPAAEAESNNNQGSYDSNMIIICAVAVGVVICIANTCITIIAVCCLRGNQREYYRDEDEQSQYSRSTIGSGGGGGGGKSTRTLQSSSSSLSRNSRHSDRSRGNEREYYRDEDELSQCGGGGKSTRTLQSSRNSRNSDRSLESKSEGRNTSGGGGKSTRTSQSSSSSSRDKSEGRSTSGGGGKSTRTLPSSSSRDSIRNSDRSLQSKSNRAEIPAGCF